MEKIYNKLVRDKIPEIIQKDGKKAVLRTLTEEEFLQELNKKMKEELDEYLKSGDIMELVDLGEVMHAILAIRNMPISEYQRLRVEKHEARGGFDQRLFLEKVIE
ncbi:MAG: nucleoside triphosphate pyrophosphohydrolase [Candidatus Izemoplasmatales bacterium]|nr:nucleoside triphosphate pyrophosphohydrolase [Candidatus Izemoplasmatales bacterium]